MRMKMYTLIAAVFGLTIVACGDADKDTGSGESEDSAAEEAEEQE